MVVPAPIRYILDTNIIVHYIRGGDLASRLEAAYGLSTLPLTPIVSVVSEGEIRSLAAQFNWGPEKLRKLNTQIARLVVVQLDLTGLTDAYAQIDNYSRSLGGREMGQNDMWIAATAHVSGAHLLPVLVPI